ncbi:hypothetical protein RRF57_010890 [Xylaria bambusicola]|uniref:DNA polymerase epsilon subunit D n=1 Tax=Xylaria bambusicola TaxID=326684 RepID=A0AAN7UXA3_9PEZI
MAPKKIDPAKRGDVSMAQFVYDGDVDRSEPATAVPLQLKNTTPSTSTPATQMEMNGPAETSLLGEKEKDKDKEKKEKEKDTVTIEDLTLPKSIITRLAKGVLPSNTQIQANAILAMSKSATIFINHIANAANEHTLDNNKKTIMPGDVFAALEDIEFPFFRERLEAEFKKFNDTQTTKRNTYRRKVAAQKKAQTDAADPNTSLISTASTAAAESDAAPRSKKQKPNAAHEESAMDVDGNETQEPRDASDADTEPEQEHEEDDEDEENAAGEEEEEEEDDEDEEENDDEVHNRLEERPNRQDDDDDALDNDGDSD